MTWSIGRRVAVGFLAALLPFLIVAALWVHTSSELVETFTWVSHTERVRATLADIPAQVRDLRAASRGFVITGMDEMLVPFELAATRLPNRLAELRSLTADNPRQQERLDRLDLMLAQIQAHWRGNIDLRRARGFEAARDRVAGGEGEVQSVAIDRLIAEMIAEEGRLLRMRTDAAQNAVGFAHRALIGAVVLGIGLVTGIGLWLTGDLTRRLAQLVTGAERLGAGHLDARVAAGAGDELGTLAAAFNRMAERICEAQAALAERDWSKDQQARLSRLVQDHRELPALARALLPEVAPLVGADLGILYLRDPAAGPPCLREMATHGIPGGTGSARCYRESEGLVGRCWRERQMIVVGDLPADYVRVTSGLGEAAPRQVVLVPVCFEQEVLAVIELAALRPMPAARLALLPQLAEALGAGIQAVAASAHTNELLARTQQLADELRARQEELTKANRELELTSRYKTNFLTTMSHELRTPLNSLLILASLLVDNADGNLTPKQIEFARTIRASGTELLDLINDVLDLAKVESGAMAIEVADVSLQDVVDALERTFRPVATERGIAFAISRAPDLPAAVRTDARRVQQVLKNLLANAFKFTERGRVALEISPASGAIDFAVCDTGIGIPVDKHTVIFEAFRQADSGTARRFGGTGLGLAISRNLAGLLGGSLRLESAPGRGSTFTLRIPATPVAGSTVATRAPEHAAADPGARSSTTRLRDPMLADRRVLVVDDDMRNVFSLTAALEREGLVVENAESGPSALARLSQQPEFDVVLMDIMMPGMDGIEVMRTLRAQQRFARLPILAITAKAGVVDRDTCLAAGATAYLAKPVAIDALLDTIRACLSQPASGVA